MVDTSTTHKSVMLGKEQGGVVHVICIWIRRSLSTQALGKVEDDVLPNKIENAIDTQIYNVFLLYLPFITNSMA